MIPSRNSGRTPRRGLTVVECALALSVIAGLAFVTMRITDMGTPSPVTETAATDTGAASAPDHADVKVP